MEITFFLNFSILTSILLLISNMDQIEEVK